MLVVVKCLYLCVKKPVFMAMLLGTYECKLDDKGRVLFPSALLRQVRSEHEGVFILRRSEFAQCMVMYTQEDFDRLAQDWQREFPRHTVEGDRKVRQFYSTVSQVQLDRTNRLLMGQGDRDYLGLTDRVRFVGQYDCIEIWAPEAYEKALAEK